MKKLSILGFAIFLLLSCSNKIPEFEQEKAFLFLEEQCDLGYRFPGSEEIILCRNYIRSKLQHFNATIEEQVFNTMHNEKEIIGVNIIASFNPDIERRILLGAHYDTRPWADKEEDPELHKQPIIGANDGASGVAVLLEIAEVISQDPDLNLGVDLVFFDMEDMGNYGEPDTWCLGSKYFAENYIGTKPEKTIIVDMIGDRDLQIDMEYYSYKSSPSLVNKVWNIAKDLGYSEFNMKLGQGIMDDHFPLIQKGFNAIDIIDFNYEFWHTIEDTPDKCSPYSLKVVGQTLVNLIYSEQ